MRPTSSAASRGSFRRVAIGASAQRFWALALAGTAVFFGCNSVLGIEEYGPREASVDGDSGSAGEESSGGSSPAGAAGGEAPSTSGGRSTSGGAVGGAVGGASSGGRVGQGGGGSGNAPATNAGAPSGGSIQQAGEGGAGGEPTAVPRCGDGERTTNEVCDDGNGVANDGCSVSCSVESGWTCSSASPSVCKRVRSCADMTGAECQGDSCCNSPLVPGDAFRQGYPDALTATVSSFRLDRYEVTVGRFRRFLNAYTTWRNAGNPAANAAAHPAIAGSGWNTSWNNLLPANSAAFNSADGLLCSTDATLPTWTNTAAARETHPMNCFSWYVAFAFCAWDDARLPTEAEWEYAAAGGNDNRLYPWGATSPNANVAVYDCLADGSVAADCAATDILAVGSKAAGQGRYGQRDLAGSVWEWALDWQAVYPVGPTTDYAKLDAGTERTLRGGGWFGGPENLAAALRHGSTPIDRTGTLGVRCARAP